MLLRFLGGDSSVQDGDFLVEKKTWILDDTNGSNLATDQTMANCTNDNQEANCITAAGVIWEFSEIGKGTLTTNNHLNDYDFIWAIENGKLKIETSWLYLMENEYDYELDQGAGRLKLSDDNGTYYFIASGN